MGTFVKAEEELRMNAEHLVKPAGRLDARGQIVLHYPPTDHALAPRPFSTTLYCFTARYIQFSLVGDGTHLATRSLRMK